MYIPLYRIAFHNMPYHTITLLYDTVERSTLHYVHNSTLQSIKLYTYTYRSKGTVLYRVPTCKVQHQQGPSSFQASSPRHRGP